MRFFVSSQQTVHSEYLSRRQLEYVECLHYRSLMMNQINNLESNLFKC